ncbi:MAG: FRG domain-containing protein [Rhizobiaceae bacterium]|nr:FRG domain-containing protein [Rhizobiaceae bacterium]
MVDASWHVSTSLMRLGGSYASLEKDLLRNFVKYAHRDVVERDSFWLWLSVAQHHGLSTRG